MQAAQGRAISSGGQGCPLISHVSAVVLCIVLEPGQPPFATALFELCGSPALQIWQYRRSGSQGIEHAGAPSMVSSSNSSWC